MNTDKLLRIEKTTSRYGNSPVWRAVYAGPNGDATICACATKRATELNAEFIMRTLPNATWAALVSRPNVTA